MKDIANTPLVSIIMRAIFLNSEDILRIDESIKLRT